MKSGEHFQRKLSLCVAFAFCVFLVFGFLFCLCWGVFGFLFTIYLSLSFECFVFGKIGGNGNPYKPTQGAQQRKGEREREREER